MSLLFAPRLAIRRGDRTGLLLAGVVDVLPCTVDEAYRRFPAEAHRCNLRMRSARRKSHTVTCIVVQNVRPAPEFSFLVPGNLGFLHQFSLEKGTPQFCLTSDLNKTVGVYLQNSGRTVQRTLMMSARARISTALSGENNAVAHVGSMASLPRGRTVDGGGEARGDRSSTPQPRKAEDDVISIGSPAAGGPSFVDLTGKPGVLHTTPCHPFATLLDGSPVCGGPFTSVHAFVEASLNTLFTASVSHHSRKAVCAAMLDRLDSADVSDNLPAYPSLLSLQALKTLGLGRCMHGGYLDMFLKLFGEAGGFKGHKLANESIAFDEKPAVCPFATGDEKDSIVLHGLHLFEQIDLEKSWTEKFARDFDGAFDANQIAVGIRGRSVHFQAFTLHVHKPRPEMSFRCSMDWTLETDTQDRLNKVVQGKRSEPELSVNIRKVPAPMQLSNECACRALGDAFELALNLSHGREGLERDRQFCNVKGRDKTTIVTKTNQQGERLRLFILLWILRGMSMAHPSCLFPPFEKELAVAKQSLRRGKDSLMIDLSTPPASKRPAAAADGRKADGQMDKCKVLPHRRRPPPAHQPITFL